MRDISTLTATQAKSFSKEQVLLKDNNVRFLLVACLVVSAATTAIAALVIIPRAASGVLVVVGPRNIGWANAERPNNKNTMQVINEIHPVTPVPVFVTQNESSEALRTVCPGAPTRNPSGD